jgi:membrane associated rhomboid family serine protease
MQDPDIQPPVNPLPPAVILMFLAIAGVEAGLTLGEAGLIGGPGAVGWRLGLMQEYGFHGEIVDRIISIGNWRWSDVSRFFSFSFVHQSFTHALFAMVLLLALGKLVSEAMGQLAFVAIFILSGVIGAVTYGFLLDDPSLMIGAYPNAYGLIGGYSFVMWRHLAGRGTQQYRAFSLIAVLMGIQLVWGVFFETGTMWVAELFGFLCGFGLCFLLAPGEWARIRAKLQRR